MKILDYKIYSFLCVLFAVIIVIGNLIYQKFVYLPILPFYTFELSVGAIFYPLTFMLTDLIAEFYGKEKANFCVKIALSINILVVLIIYLMDCLNATPWSKIDNQVFHKVFGMYGVSFVGSLVACYIAQLVDITIYLTIRRITGHRYLWLRSNVSTALSLFIDTSIVISILSFFGVLPIEKASILVFNSYIFKLFFSISSIPLFYAAVATIKYISEPTQ